MQQIIKGIDNLPEIWEYMIANLDKCIDVRGKEYLLDIFREIAITMGCITPAQAIICFRQIMREMDLKKPEANKRNEELVVLCRSVNPVRLRNNPVSIDQKATINLYSIIL